MVRDKADAILVFSQGRAVYGTQVPSHLVVLDRSQDDYMDHGFWLRHYKAIPL